MRIVIFFYLLIFINFLADSFKDYVFGICNPRNPSKEGGSEKRNTISNLIKDKKDNTKRINFGGNSNNNNKEEIKSVLKKNSNDNSNKNVKENEINKGNNNLSNKKDEKRRKKKKDSNTEKKDEGDGCIIF